MVSPTAAGRRHSRRRSRRWRRGAETGREITHDSTRNDHGRQAGPPRLLNGRGNTHVDRIAHGNRAVEVEREPPGLHGSAAGATVSAGVIEPIPVTPGV